MVDLFNPVAPDAAPSPMMERIHELYMAACAHDQKAAEIVMMPHVSGIMIPYSIEEFAIAWEDPEFTFVVMDLLDCRSLDIHRQEIRESSNHIARALRTHDINQTDWAQRRDAAMQASIQTVNAKVSLLAGGLFLYFIIQIVLSIIH